MKITSSPTEAGVLVNGHQRVGETPMVLEREGGTRVDILLVKDGFEPYRREVYVPEGKTLIHHAELRPKQALLLVTSNGIIGADIYLEGVLVSKTPSRVEVMADTEQLIEVKKRGFHSYQERVKVKAGERLDFDADIYPAIKQGAPEGWLRFQSSNPVMVFLDGRKLGSTPLLRIRIKAKPHQLKIVSMDKQRSKTKNIVVKPGEAQVVNVDLDDLGQPKD